MYKLNGMPSLDVLCHLRNADSRVEHVPKDGVLHLGYDTNDNGDNNTTHHCNQCCNDPHDDTDYDCNHDGNDNRYYN